MTQRPFLLRFCPPRIGDSLASRWYMPRAERYSYLFDAAPLALVPSVRMYDLIPGDLVSDRIALTGRHEHQLAKRILAQARRGGLMVDVGANMGFFSLLWAAANENNEVYSFEPDSRCLQRLRKNVAANGFSDRIRVIDKACADFEGECRFTAPTGVQTGWQGIIRDDADASALSVATTTLDSVFSDIGGQIALLKIDTEGADTLVLRGAAQLLARQKIAMICFEQNRERMEALGLQAGEAQDLLRDAGYRVWPMAADQFEWLAVLPGDAA